MNLDANYYPLVILHSLCEKRNGVKRDDPSLSKISEWIHIALLSTGNNGPNAIWV